MANDPSADVGPVGQAGEATDASQPQSPKGLMGQWNDWLSKPENRNMLIQTGLNLLQPPGPGQSTVGAIGESIGAGFEGRDEAIKQRLELQRQQQEQARLKAEQESQTQLRGAQTQEYLSRAKLYEQGGAGAAVRGRELYARNLQAFRSQRDSYVNQMLLTDNPDEKQHLQELVQILDSQIDSTIREMGQQAGGDAGGAGPKPTQEQIDSTVADAKERIKNGTLSREDAEKAFDKLGIDKTLLDK